MIKKLFYLAIITLGVGMAVPNTRAMMVEKATPMMDRFKVRITVGRLEAMANQLAARANRGEGFPSNFQGWLERDYTSSAEDPWGNAYYFQTRRDGFVVGSMGPDGRENTGDDIQDQRRLSR